MQVVLHDVMRKTSPLSLAPGGSQDMLRVDSFQVKYRADGSVEQFVSGLSVLDAEEQLQQRQDISVNHPLHYKVGCAPCVVLSVQLSGLKLPKNVACIEGCLQALLCGHTLAAHDFWQCCWEPVVLPLARHL